MAATGERRIRSLATTAPTNSGGFGDDGSMATRAMTHFMAALGLHLRGPATTFYGGDGIDWMAAKTRSMAVKATTALWRVRATTYTARSGGLGRPTALEGGEATALWRGEARLEGGRDAL